jgi:nucleoside-diphosphate-sugar epimerase
MRAMGLKTLVIGGTGPTGPYVVRGLLERGHDVVICHTGRHEVPEIASEVEHIHTDPFDREALERAFVGRTFGVAIAAYGRLRSVAEVLVGRCERLLTVGGMPAYRGYMDADRFAPPGLPIPTREDALRSTQDDDPKSFRVARTEDALFSLHPRATHFRYPYVYGPRQLTPREWPIVRRIVDRRPFIVVPDGGLTIYTYGYAENLAHALLLAVDQPEASAGHVFNAADETAFTLAQTIEIIALALGRSIEMVSMPYELAPVTRPLIRQLRTTHRFVSVDKLVHRLGYRDVVPAADAIARTARWLVANPPSEEVEARLEDPFDYMAEDQLVAQWRTLVGGMTPLEFAAGEPGLTLGHQGPGTSNPRRDHRIDPAPRV